MHTFLLNPSRMHIDRRLTLVPTPFHRNDVPVSYAEEQQAIATVQLVRPRPGVFAEAIRHLLVICTTTEVSSASFSC